MNNKKIEYLTFEGGGGKAIAYLGAIRVMEILDVLPYIKGQDGSLKGIAGSSGGAITSFFLAMGLNANEINSHTKNDNYDDFYDEPTPGVYKAVVYNNRSKKNESGFINTSIESVKRNVNIATRPILQSSNQFFKKNFDLYEIIDDRFFTTSIELAKRKGQYVKSFNLKRFKYLLPSSLLILEIIKKLKIDKADPESFIPPLKKIIESNSKTIFDYGYNIIFDRGIFSGVNIREYFTKLLVKYLNEKYDTELTVDEARIYTFKQLYSNTLLHVKIIGTNLSTNKPKTFDYQFTPDFPFIDAVCLSMSIPGAFRPTFVNAIVDIQKYNSGNPSEEDKEFLQDFMGLYVDGGTTNNLAIHAFDNIRYINRYEFFASENPTVSNEKTDKFDFPIFSLPHGMLGIRSQSGSDKSEFSDYKEDNLYKKYSDLKKKAPYPETIEKKTYFKSGVPLHTSYLLKHSSSKNKVLSTLFDFIGDLYETVLYYTEEGQIQSIEESKQVIPLYAYDVGLYDFDLSKEPHKRFLSAFVQRTATMKTARFLNVTNKSYKELRKKYFNNYINDSFSSTNEDEIKEYNLFKLVYENYDIDNIK